jgi:hypothetical protein
MLTTETKQVLKLWWDIGRSPIYAGCSRCELSGVEGHGTCILSCMTLYCRWHIVILAMLDLGFP